MTTARESQIHESSTAAAYEGLIQYLGTSMRPGARLRAMNYVWPFWHDVGEFECKSLGAEHFEFRVAVHVKPFAPIELTGSLRLVDSARCVLMLGHDTDRDAKYFREHNSFLVESQGFGAFKPSIRFWREGAETKADIFINVGIIRPKLHAAIVPPKSAMIDGWDEAMGSLGAS